MSSFPLRRSYLHRGGDQPLIGDTIDAFVRAVMRRHAARDADRNESALSGFTSVKTLPSQEMPDPGTESLRAGF